MSATAMVETYDMPMTDYNEDGDIPMAGSSTENWFQNSSHMDEDVHNVEASDPVEVDMMSYEETTTEYEMDDVAQPTQPPMDLNVVDAEVYDITIHSSSPIPAAPVPVTENYSMVTAASDPPGALSIQPSANDNAYVAMSQVSDSAAPQIFALPNTEHVRAQSVVSESHHSEYTPAPEVLDHGYEHHIDEHGYTAGSSLVSIQPSEEHTNTGEGRSSLPEHFAPQDHISHLEASEEHTEEVHHEEPPTDPAATELSHKNIEGVAHEYTEGDLHDTATEEGGAGGAVEDGAEHHETHATFIPPPPAIFLALQVTSTEGDQPDFVLFNLPEASSHTAEEPLVLLQHQPSLFYEPISAVFEAFRQEEYFSHLEELSEAEMALNAQELQLVISEDNIYAREVSLHDLHAMHQGVGLPGHLRLTLQSVVPRFIARYNVLRDQITRLVLSDEPEEVQHHGEDVPDGEQDDGAEAFAEPAVPSQVEGHEEEHQHATGENEDHEGSVHLQDPPGDNDSRHDEVSPDEVEANYDQEQEEEQDAEHAALEEAGPEDEEDTEHSDESDNVLDMNGNHVDGAEDELDADGVHSHASEDSDNDVEQTLEEQATEYTDVAEPHEEGDEGYGNDFEEDGEEGTGTVASENAAAPSEDNAEEAYDEEKEIGLEPIDAQAQAISHSTSTSSYSTDDSAWEAEVQEVDAVTDLNEQTDHSIQQENAHVSDEEGNFTENVRGGDVEFGDDDFGDDDFGDDDFGDDDFDNSAEGTLKDSSEGDELANNEDAPGDTEKSETAEKAENVENEADATAEAVLAESEKFVSALENDGDNLDLASKVANNPNPKDENLETKSSVATDAVENDKSVTVHKKHSKRSLDDAELDDDDNEAAGSPPSSPDSKRTRTL